MFLIGELFKVIRGKYEGRLGDAKYGVGVWFMRLEVHEGLLRFARGHVFVLVRFIKTREGVNRAFGAFV